MDIRGRLRSLDIFVTPTRLENCENNSKCYTPCSLCFRMAKSLTLASKREKEHAIRSLSLSLLPFLCLSLAISVQLKVINEEHKNA